MRTQISMIAAPAAAMTLIKGALLASVLLAFAPGAFAADVPSKGTTPYVTHFVFRPVQSIDIPELGQATLLEAVGTTENMKGEAMLDKMSARCTALSVDSGPKKYIDGACVLADADGDKIFSTFDTRDLDKSQPESIAARISSPAAPANIPASPAASHSTASPCPISPAPAATRRWTFPTTRAGKSRNSVSLPRRGSGLEPGGAGMVPHASLSFGRFAAFPRL